MIVVDASVLLEVILLSPAAGPLIQRLRSADARILAAPELIDLEVLQVLRRFTLAARITPRRAQQAVADFQALALRRYAHRPLLPRIWELHANVSAYDASYLALSEQLAVPVISRDTRWAQVPGCRAQVEIF